MENQVNSQPDCGCGDGCCTPPKKRNKWQMLIFIIIVLGAIAIVALKFTGKSSANQKADCKTECSQHGGACCDTTSENNEAGCKDSSKQHKCCPQSK